MLLPFKYGIPKQLFFWKGGRFCFSLHFGAMLHAQQWWGGQGWISATVLAPQQKIMCNPFPRLHSCAQMEWGRWGSSVLSLADVTANSLKTSLCIFLFYFNACQHLFSRRKSTYANICQEQERKAISSGSMKWACLLTVGFFSLC